MAAERTHGASGHETCVYHKDISHMVDDVSSSILWIGRIARAILAILCAIMVILYSSGIRISDSITDMTLLSKSNAQHIQMLYDKCGKTEAEVQQLWRAQSKLNKQKNSE